MRYEVKGSRGGGRTFKTESFDTEEAAKQRAFELLDAEGAMIVVNIWLEGSQEPLRNFVWIEEQYRIWKRRIGSIKD